AVTVGPETGEALVRALGLGQRRIARVTCARRARRRLGDRGLQRADALAHAIHALRLAGDPSLHDAEALPDPSVALLELLIDALPDDRLLLLDRFAHPLLGRAARDHDRPGGRADRVPLHSIHPSSPRCADVARRSNVWRSRSHRVAPRHAIVRAVCATTKIASSFGTSAAADRVAGNARSMPGGAGERPCR